MYKEPNQEQEKANEVKQSKRQGKGKMKVITEARIKLDRAETWQNERQVQSKRKTEIQ